MKKKLLLVGVAAMGLLAVGVGATSTFAWFSASTAAGNVGATTAQNADLTVNKTTHEAAGIEVPLIVKAVDNIAPHHELALAKFKNQSGTNKNLVSGFLDGAGTFQEESDLTKFAHTIEDNTNPQSPVYYTDWDLYSSLDITVEVDFTKVWSNGNAGWAGNAGNAAYDAVNNPYSYSAKPQYWKNADGSAQYSATEILDSLDGKSVDVGIKQVTTTRGRLFETNAANDAYGYTVSAGTEKTANSTGGLTGYFETATDVGLTGIKSAAKVVKDDLFYYVFGDEAGYTSGAHTPDGSSVTATFQGTVIPHA